MSIRQVPNRLCSTDKEVIVEKYRSGSATINELAFEYDVHKNTIKNILKAYDEGKLKLSNDHMTEADLRKKVAKLEADLALVNKKYEALKKVFPYLLESQ